MNGYTRVVRKLLRPFFMILLETKLVDALPLNEKTSIDFTNSIFTKRLFYTCNVWVHAAVV